MSRTQFLNNADLSNVWPSDIDVRFYCGESDASESPLAYKDAGKIILQIEKFNLHATNS